jgi:hypothetical protein
VIVKMNCKTMKNTEFQSSVSELMCMRRTVLPKRLVLPGPDGNQLQALLAAAATGHARRAALSDVGSVDRPCGCCKTPTAQIKKRSFQVGSKLRQMRSGNEAGDT